MNQPAESIPSKSRVVVAACPSYSSGDVAAALAEIMDALGGMAAVIKPGETVLVKLNLFSPHDPDDAVTTHPELVKQVVQLCFEAGAGRVWVGDSPVGTHPDAELWSRTGMTAAVAGTNAELKSWHVRQTSIPCGSETLAVPAWFSEVDAVISLAKLKNHCLTTMTCALKNVYGIVSGQAKAQFHTKYPSPLAMSAFLVSVFAALRPRLTIGDAVVAMEGNGPARGTPLPVGALLASRDAVALDAVACTPLRITPRLVPMIRLAAEAGLGVMDESRIDCQGSGIAALRKARMRPSMSRLMNFFPEWVFARKLRLLRMRPKIRQAMCVKCGMCVEACPRKVISLQAQTGYPIIDERACIDCFCCLESCPQSAIAVQYRLGRFIRVTRTQAWQRKDAP